MTRPKPPETSSYSSSPLGLTMLVALACGVGCADDVTSTDTDFTASGFSTGTSDTGDTQGDGDPGDGDPGDGDGDPGDGDGDPTPEECGDDMVSGAEECDGADLGGQDCLALGFDEGDLGCNPDCTLDTSMCVELCGDGMINNADEECDGDDLAMQDCVSLGMSLGIPFIDGTLACDTSCAFDTSMCMAETCNGDGIDGSDVCDGDDLGGEDCTTQGFEGGTLACDPNCQGFDTSGCFSCGDGMVGGSEQCDGMDLNGEDCTTQGFTEGTLACDMACGFDTSMCTTCGDDMVEGMEQCDNMNLNGEDCASQGFTTGILACDMACGFDTSMCTTCGDDMVEGMEVCDNMNLNGEDCTTQGFTGGTLACGMDCATFDTSMCTNGGCEEEDIGTSTGPAVTSGDTTGGDDDLTISCAANGGAEQVIAFTSIWAGDYVFDTFGSGYDTALAAFGDCNPNSEITCNDDTGGLQSQITVSMGVGETILLAVDGFNGSTGAWTLNITPPAAPAAPGCTEEDILANLGNPVTSGNTGGEDEDIAQSCGGGGGPDYMVRFIAPATADFSFDTFGSGYDTVLAAYDDCNANTEIICNDDTGGLQSEIVVSMTVGQEIMIAVSGFNGSTGTFLLDVNQI